MENKKKGYWFSTESGAHIFVEEGQSKEQAMNKVFDGKSEPKKTRLSSKAIDAKADELAEEYYDKYGTYPSDMSVFREKAKKELVKLKQEKDFNDSMEAEHNKAEAKEFDKPEEIDALYRPSEDIGPKQIKGPVSPNDPAGKIDLQDNKSLYESAIKENWINKFDPEKHDIDEYYNDYNTILKMHDYEPISKEEFKNIVGYQKTNKIESIKPQKQKKLDPFDRNAMKESGITDKLIKERDYLSPQEKQDYKDIQKRKQFMDKSKAKIREFATKKDMKKADDFILNSGFTEEEQKELFDEFYSNTK